MTLDEAKTLLATCKREEVRDHAFSDAEVYWMSGDEEAASGYFGLDAREVSVGDTRFTDDDADALRWLGAKGTVTRNDTPRCPLCDIPLQDGCDCVAEILAEEAMR